MGLGSDNRVHVQPRSMVAAIEIVKEERVKRGRDQLAATTADRKDWGKIHGAVRVGGCQ